MVDEVMQENFLSVVSRIQAACKRAGRNPAEVKLIWVSKNHPQPRLLEAQALGARVFGENRVQEVLEKFPLPVTLDESGKTIDCELHFIGRMQKNKIRKVLPLATTIHSIDSLELLEAVDRIAGELGLLRNVFLQVNTTREAAKGGFESAEFPKVLNHLPPVPNLRIIGLMTMGPAENANGGPTELEETRRCFRELAGLLKMGQGLPVDQLKDLAWLSMGMSGDFEVAIEEGAHFIRIGTSLFGSRLK
jgi:PLP dependent protein